LSVMQLMQLLSWRLNCLSIFITISSWHTVCCSKNAHLNTTKQALLQFLFLWLIFWDITQVWLGCLMSSGS